jgi:hypothetical protein
MLDEALLRIYEIPAEAHAIILHPRDYWNLRGWTRWQDRTAGLGLVDPRWPRFIRRRLERRRRLMLDRRWAAWLARHPWKP